MKILVCDPDCPVWERMAEKWILGEEWPKNGKIGPKMGQQWPFSHFSANFSPFFGGARIHFLAVFLPLSRSGGPISGLYRAIGIANLGGSFGPEKKISSPSSLQTSPQRLYPHPLRGPVAILFISRDTCSDSIAAKLIRACFCEGGYRTIIARYVAEWGIAQMCLCETKYQGGGYRIILGEC